MPTKIITPKNNNGQTALKPWDYSVHRSKTYKSAKSSSRQRHTGSVSPKVAASESKLLTLLSSRYANERLLHYRRYVDYSVTKSNPISTSSTNYRRRLIATTISPKNSSTDSRKNTNVTNCSSPQRSARTVTNSSTNSQVKTNRPVKSKVSIDCDKKLPKQKPPTKISLIQDVKCTQIMKAPTLTLKKDNVQKNTSLSSGSDDGDTLPTVRDYRKPSLVKTTSVKTLKTKAVEKENLGPPVVVYKPPLLSLKEYTMNENSYFRLAEDLLNSTTKSHKLPLLLNPLRAPVVVEDLNSSILPLKSIRRNRFKIHNLSLLSSTLPTTFGLDGVSTTNENVNNESQRITSPSRIMGCVYLSVYYDPEMVFYLDRYTEFT